MTTYPTWFEDAISKFPDRAPSKLPVKEVLEVIPDEVLEIENLDSVDVSYWLRQYRKAHKPVSLKSLIENLVNNLTEDDLKLLGEANERLVTQIKVKLQ